MIVTCVLRCLARAAAMVQRDGGVRDPKSPELLKLAAPLVVDESNYGCGPLHELGRTYFVSLNGSDEANGLTWDTAWRHVHVALGNLNAGDTLIIGEGEYIDPNMTISQSADDFRAGYLASNNCYFGKGADRERIVGEMRSVVGDPKFADAA